MGEFNSVFGTGGIEGGVEVGLAGSIVREAGEGGDVLVGGAKEEHVDGDLSTGAFDGEGLIEGRCGLQKTGFLSIRKG